jgi:glycolate oxidase iron-sulfur subunit
METNFTLAQLADPDVAVANGILRACVHCGFCNATCPTYALLGDELDGPRGRIYLIKDMLENDRPASPAVVKHIDRCLSCLSCMTTCPSGVHYMHLVDHARQRIEATYRRPLSDRLLRALLAWVLPWPGRFRAALLAGRLGRFVAPLLPGRLAALARLAGAPPHPPAHVDRPQRLPASGTLRKRVALLTGCAQRVLAPQINEATVRLLQRHGCEVIVAAGAGCCGALTHHLGRDALGMVRANVDAWSRDDVDAVVVNASGCGTMVKDYGFLLRGDEAYAAKAARISAMARDVSELIAELGLEAPVIATGHRVAYHAACSLSHGQRVTAQPRRLLAAAGFDVAEVPEGHLCCGSAGTYNMLQPELAMALRDRKLRNIASTAPDVVAAGNIGCIVQLASAAPVPVVHTVELLDWATGGPVPPALGD